MDVCGRPDDGGRGWTLAEGGRVCGGREEANLVAAAALRTPAILLALTAALTGTEGGGAAHCEAGRGSPARSFSDFRLGSGSWTGGVAVSSGMGAGAGAEDILSAGACRFRRLPFGPGSWERVLAAESERSRRGRMCEVEAGAGSRDGGRRPDGLEDWIEGISVSDGGDQITNRGPTYQLVVHGARRQVGGRQQHEWQKVRENPIHAACP